jgi:hypothetical protein
MLRMGICSAAILFLPAICRRLLYLCNKPPFELRAFQELNRNRLTLMEGSALSGADLERCGAVRAHLQLK